MTVQNFHPAILRINFENDTVHDIVLCIVILVNVQITLELNSCAALLDRTYGMCCDNISDFCERGPFDLVQKIQMREMHTAYFAIQ